MESVQSSFCGLFDVRFYLNISSMHLSKLKDPDGRAEILAGRWTEEVNQRKKQKYPEVHPKKFLIMSGQNKGLFDHSGLKYVAYYNVLDYLQSIW